MVLSAHSSQELSKDSFPQLGFFQGALPFSLPSRLHRLCVTGCASVSQAPSASSPPHALTTANTFPSHLAVPFHSSALTLESTLGALVTSAASHCLTWIALLYSTCHLPAGCCWPGLSPTPIPGASGQQSLPASLAAHSPPGRTQTSRCSINGQD